MEKAIIESNRPVGQFEMYNVNCIMYNDGNGLTAETIFIKNTHHAGAGRHVDRLLLSHRQRFA